MAAPTSANGDVHCVASWISHLRILSPPEGLAHVGAGDGSNLPDYAQWGVDDVVLVEAGEASAKRLADLVRPHANWQVLHRLVSESDGEFAFHLASNPRESGLVPADELRAVWRNLQSLGHSLMPATCIDTMLSPEAAPRINWLVVDCLPAARLLRGAVRLLERCDVVVTRVLLHPSNFDGAASESSLNAVSQLLSEHGFLLLATQEERMPSLGRAVYARKPGAGQRVSMKMLDEASAQTAGFQQLCEQQGVELERLQAELTLHHEQTRELESVRAELASANQLRAEETATFVGHQSDLESRIALLQAQLSAMEGERNNLIASQAVAGASLMALEAQLQDQRAHTGNAERLAADQLNQATALNEELRARELQVLEATQRADNLQQSLTECQAKLEELAQFKAHCKQLEQQVESGNQSSEALRNAISEYQIQIGKLETEKAQVEGNLASTFNHAHFADRERERLTAELDAVKIQFADREGQVAKLSQELANQGLQHQDYQRQLSKEEKARQLFAIEMARAEAQITLIRDVLLRKAETEVPFNHGRSGDGP